MTMKIRINGTGASTSAIYLISVRIITIVLSFVITRILSQYLSIYDYGTYSQVTLIISTVTSLTILGMSDAINYFYCKEQDENIREQYISTIFGLQCFIGVISILAILLFSNVICEYFKNSDLKPLILLTSALPLLQNLLAMLQVLFISVGKSKSIAVRNLIYSVLKLLITYIACVFFNDVTLIFVLSLCWDAVQCYLFIQYLYKNNCKLKFNSFNYKLIKTIFRYSIPMAAFTVVNAISRDMDKYVISLFGDAETLAVYTNAAKTLPFDIIMTSFCTVLLPHLTSFIASGENEKAASLYKKFLQLTYITTVIMAVTVLISAPNFMTLLYTEKYLSGVSVFCVYIFVDVLKFTNITLLLSAAGKTKTIMNISIIGLLCNFVLNFVLYKLLGIVGPALATLVVTVIIGILILKYSIKALNAKFKDFFDLKHLIFFIIETTIIASVCYFIRRLLDNIEMHYFISLLIVSVIFIVAMIVINYRKIISLLKDIEKVKFSN